jgi:hypothetical protein
MAQELSAPRRAVVLGASNVFRSIATVVAAAQAARGAPLDLFIAAGHGRSFGMWNRVLGYSVPGIVQCGLWDALAARTNVPTAALITDVGNDLLYGASAPTILGWVETCLARLRPQCEQIVVTELPLTSLARLTSARFVMFRTALFPASRMTLAQAIDGANCLNDGLQALAEKYFCTVVVPRAAWYGFDPIHVEQRHVSAAWHELLASWRTSEATSAARGSLWQWSRLRARRIHVQRFMGRQRETPQPALRYADGSTISLY